MVTAIVAALVVSITAVVVLNLTFRRFEISAFRSDHAVAAVEAEGGNQFAWAWFLDPANHALVQAAGAAGYRIAGNADSLPWVENGVQLMGAENEVDPTLVLGNKIIVVEIVHRAAPPWVAADPIRHCRVRALARFGTGEAD